MKPSNFIMNSDYLSIAQTETNTYQLTVGAGTLQVNGFTEQNFNFTTSAQTGAVDRILIKKDGGDYLLGSYMTLVPVWSSSYNNNISGFLQVFRTSSTNLRAQLVLQNMGSAVASYPAMAFSIKVASFKPPNVF